MKGLFLSLPLLFFVDDVMAQSNKKEESGLDINVVRRVVRTNLAQVQRCYTDLIIEGMATKGKVIASWEIDDKGAVQNIQITENTSNDPALEGCVTERVVNWTFPPAKPGSTFQVAYPFQFQ